jgi:hypothetical protein
MASNHQKSSRQRTLSVAQSANTPSLASLLVQTLAAPLFVSSQPTHLLHAQCFSGSPRNFICSLALFVCSEAVICLFGLIEATPTPKILSCSLADSGAQKSYENVTGVTLRYGRRQ